MTWKEYKLDDTVSKSTEDIRLWETETGILEIDKNTVATSIMLDDKRKGYVFHGQGKLLIDTIVETEEGAIGKSLENKLNEPFLMLGDTENLQKNLTKASEEDFTRMGYKNSQELLDEAETLCNLFFKRKLNSNEDPFEDRGLVFAFPNNDNKLDLLVVKDSKIIYKGTKLVFVSKDNKVVLKIPGEVICTSNGRSVVIKK